MACDRLVQPYPSEASALLRCLIVIACVALLSGLLNHFQLAQGQREFVAGPTPQNTPEQTWVRTADGWERSSVLQPNLNPIGPPALHPLLVAGFQVTASLLALLAFPAVRALTGSKVARRG
jgi:hypothetical protein